MNINELIAQVDALHEKTILAIHPSDYGNASAKLRRVLQEHWPTISAELKRLQGDNYYMFAALELTEGRLKDREATIEKARKHLELIKPCIAQIDGALAALDGLAPKQWCEKCGCGNDKAGYAHLETCTKASDAGGGWLPIETAPKDGSEFVAANARQGFVKQLVSWNILHGFWRSKGEFIHMQHTHWFPLPAAPKGGE